MIFWFFFIFIVCNRQKNWPMFNDGQKFMFFSDLLLPIFSDLMKTCIKKVVQFNPLFFLDQTHP